MHGAHRILQNVRKTNKNLNLLERGSLGGDERWPEGHWVSLVCSLPNRTDMIEHYSQGHYVSHTVQPD
jgi:hypothetical protein